jgi:hypothetical protein
MFRRGSILLLAFAALACGDDTGTGPGSVFDSGEQITLTLRVHLLESDVYQAIDATLSDAQVDTLMTGVNEIWAQAGIAFHVESIVREPGLNGDDWERMLAGQIAPSVEIALSIVPRDNLTADDWDVFVVRDYGQIAGGIYLYEIPAVLFAENGPFGPQPPASDGRRILAHELGHSLGLGHVICAAQGNLMAPGCLSGVRSRLTAVQIQAARQVALSGRPFPSDNFLADIVESIAARE